MTACAVFGGSLKQTPADPKSSRRGARPILSRARVGFVFGSKKPNKKGQEREGKMASNETYHPEDARAQRGILPCEFLWAIFARSASHPKVSHLPCLGRICEYEDERSDTADGKEEKGGVAEEKEVTRRGFEWESYAEVLTSVRAIATGLVRHGIVPDLSLSREGQAESQGEDSDDQDVDQYAPGSAASVEVTGPDRPGRAVVAICGLNSPSWVKADLAVLRQAAISVPLSVPGKGASIRDISFVLRHAEASAVLCGVPQVADILTACSTPVDGVEDRCVVKTFVLFDEEPHSADALAGALAAIEAAGFRALRLSQLAADGSTAEPVFAVKRVPNAIHTIMYTSGSTGNPKGAVLSAERWVRFMSTPWMMPDPLYHLSYAPLAHIMEVRPSCVLSSNFED
jgi:non-ribosomal peptide synthetase component F